MKKASKKMIDTPQKLESLRNKLEKQKSPSAKSISVCIGTGCAAQGSRKIYELFCEAVKDSGSKVEINALAVMASVSEAQSLLCSRAIYYIRTLKSRMWKKSFVKLFLKVLL